MKTKDDIATEAMLEGFNSDHAWSLPWVSVNEDNDGLDPNNEADLSTLCNLRRKQTLKIARNTNVHKSNGRKILEQHYLAHKPVKWQAIVSDFAFPRKNIKKMSPTLLLDHVVLAALDSEKINLGYINTKKQLDYHMWLQINNIKYFSYSIKGSQRISIGDILFGESYVTQYHDYKGNAHYSLGKTIINACGVPLVQDFFPGKENIIGTHPRIVCDYDRKEDWVVDLSYPNYYQAILKRYKKVTIQTLQYVKGNLHIFEKRNFTTSYQDRLKQNQKFSDVNEMQKNFMKPIDSQDED